MYRPTSGFKVSVVLDNFQIFILLGERYRESYVLVVPTKPQPSFVSPIRCTVEPLVHPPKHIEAACVCGICVVDDAVGECECAHARRLSGVGGNVGAGHGCEIAYASRVWYRADRTIVIFNAAGALLFLSDRGVEVVIEIAIQ